MIEICIGTSTRWMRFVVRSFLAGLRVQLAREKCRIGNLLESIQPQSLLTSFSSLCHTWYGQEDWHTPCNLKEGMFT